MRFICPGAARTEFGGEVRKAKQQSETLDRFQPWTEDSAFGNRWAANSGDSFFVLTRYQADCYLEPQSTFCYLGNCMNQKRNRRSFLKKAAFPAIFAPPAIRTIRSEVTSGTRYKLRFAIVSDGHFGQPDTDYLRFHQEMIRWINDEHAGKGLDFIILNGDLIHDTPEYLPKLKTILSDLTTRYFAVKGNHDMVSAETWQQVWGYEDNYSFERDGYGFLLGTTSNEKGEYLCVNREWLRDSLENFRDKRAVFAFFHINQNGLTRHSVSCPDVTSVLESSQNLAAVFHGHDHDQDNVIYSNKHPYFFDGHMGGSWGTNYRGYRIVEIAQDGKIGTYQCNPAAFHENRARIET